jgi:hypothetical protein
VRLRESGAQFGGVPRQNLDLLTEQQLADLSQGVVTTVAELLKDSATAAQ